MKLQHKNSPYGDDPNEICRRSLNNIVEAIEIFNGPTVPAFDSPVDKLEDLLQEMQEGYQVHDLEELQDFVNGIKDALDEIVSETKEWFKETDMDEEVKFETIERAKDQYIVRGDVYESSIDWLNSEFLDFGYHRFHGDVNVIQCLTHFGGPGGGLWIHENGAIEYWTAWGGEHGQAWATGNNYTILRNWLEEMFEMKTFSFECEHGMYDVSEDCGFNHAMNVLSAASESRDYEQSEDEDSSEE